MDEFSWWRLARDLHLRGAQVDAQAHLPQRVHTQYLNAHGFDDDADLADGEALSIPQRKHVRSAPDARRCAGVESTYPTKFVPFCAIDKDIQHFIDPARDLKTNVPADLE